MILSENRTPLFGIMRFVWRQSFRAVVLQSSDANAPRERLFMSSLPDLIRQSMLRSRSLFRSRPFSMDHRVVGERSDAVLRTAMPRGDEVWARVAPE
jgi:hypothetical protein